MKCHREEAAQKWKRVTEKKNKGNTNDACLQPAANNVSSVQVILKLESELKWWGQIYFFHWIKVILGSCILVYEFENQLFIEKTTILYLMSYKRHLSVDTFYSEHLLGARHCVKILRIHNWANTDLGSVFRASRHSCVVKVENFWCTLNEVRQYLSYVFL